MMIKIAPSILTADFGRLEEEVLKVEEAGAEYLHLDIMDGHFVPNISFGPAVVASLKKNCRMVFDVHLMIEDPGFYAEKFIDAGADIVTVHAEAEVHLHRTLELIKKKGVRTGLALNPSTLPAVLEYILDMVDLVLVMAVNPGFGGQEFIEPVLPKISAVRDLAGRKCPGLEIEVDGGITVSTASLAASAGANVLVAGSAIFNGGNPGAAVRDIRAAAMRSLL